MDNTLDDSLAEVEAEKQGNRPRDLEAKGFSDMLSNRLAEVKVEKLVEMLTLILRSLNTVPHTGSNGPSPPVSAPGLAFTDQLADRVPNKT